MKKVNLWFIPTSRFPPRSVRTWLPAAALLGVCILRMFGSFGTNPKPTLADFRGFYRARKVL